MRDLSFTKRLFLTVTEHFAAFAVLYAWRVLHIEPAGNLFIFYAWFVAIVFAFSILGLAYPAERIPRQYRSLDLINSICWGTLISILVWIGYVFLPAVLMVGWFARGLFVGRYDNEGRLKGKAND